MVDSQPENSIINLAVSHASGALRTLRRIHLLVHRRAIAAVAMLEGERWLWILLGGDGYCLVAMDNAWRDQNTLTGDILLVPSPSPGTCV